MTAASVDDALVERSSGPTAVRWPRPRGPLGHGLPHRVPAADSRCSGRAASVTPARAASSPSRTTTHGVGFAYVNNQMGGIPDDRARVLVEAVRGCLRACQDALTAREGAACASVRNC